MVQKSDYRQLRLVADPIIYRVSYMSGGFLLGFLNHQQYVLITLSEQMSKVMRSQQLDFLGDGNTLVQEPPKFAKAGT